VSRPLPFGSLQKRQLIRPSEKIFDLAAICEEVANNIDDRRASG
jgi:hypothetical protein